MSDAAAQPGDHPAATARLSCCAIIPAFDEAGRVGQMVRLGLASGLFSEVVVVDDGSTDRTSEEALAAGARVILHPQNSGKAIAMRTALESTDDPIVCFLDADLLSVSTEHLRMLVEPVLQGREQATLGVFKGGRLLTGLAQKIAPMISGQRCLQRELLRGFDDWAAGYGIETSLNAYLLSIGVKQKIVYWQGAAQVMKEEKWGLWRGAQKRARMMYQVVRAWFKSKRRN